MKKMTYRNKNSYVSGDCINQNILEKKKLNVFRSSICIGLGYNQFTHLNKRKFKDEVYLKKISYPNFVQYTIFDELYNHLLF